MDPIGINRALEKAAHSINPMDPAHVWVEVAELRGFSEGVRTCTILSRCSGCSQEKWVPK